MGLARQMRMQASVETGVCVGVCVCSALLCLGSALLLQRCSDGSSHFLCSQQQRLLCGRAQ
jgi:hypothetical protein